jgi:hypothetical protein
MAIGLVLSVLAVVGIAARLWVPGEFDLGAARAVALAGAGGLVLSFAALRTSFGSSLPLLWSLKVGIAVAAVVGIGGLWAPAGKVMILAKLVVLTASFGLAIAGSRAVTLAEIKELRRAG